MTALHLLAYICAALLLQVVAGVGVLVGRRHALAAQATRIEEPEVRAPSAAAWSGWRDFRVVGRHFEDAAQSQCSFHLQPVDGMALPAFNPGQYLTFSLRVGGGAGGVAGGERSLTRCYSLSDQPDPARYRITVKRMPPPPGRPDLPPGASSNHFHDQVRDGDVLRVKAPSGHFFIDPDATVAAVFIAGGIGITPMMSMLRWCIANQPERAVHLFYGVRNSADHAFKELLEELAGSHRRLQLHVAYSSPAPDDVQGRDYRHVGYVDLDLLRNSLPHGRHQFYVCGPPPMMQSLVPSLREWGVEEDDIRFEAFGPASVRPAGPATNESLAAPPTSLEVRLDRSGRTLVWDGQDANLLDFAERHGVAVDSGCRSGSCGTCETKVISGKVRYDDKPDHDIAPGHCLLCVGKPQSALVLEA
ncbi:MAG: 2Fe-2S iron-sulfur cluster binding domain-containing protein [Burkholderiales bacterium]|nr:2Fe-2S iron-sulfur cluster binding domain-containing protein [Burkholderiales bacterium]